MKTNPFAAAFASGIIAFTASASVFAAADKGVEVSGNVALTSDYRFRGLEQSDGGPAIQGGFDVDLGRGIYVGTWASNIDFGGTSDASMEIDYYVGYAGEISDAISYDVGYIYYDYPQSGNNNGVDDNLDYDEWYVSFSVADVTVGAVYSDDFTGDVGAARYFYTDYSLDLGNEVSLDLHYGHNEFADSGTSGGANGYDDVSIGVSKALMGVDFSLAYVGTHQLDFDGFGDDGLVFTVSKSL